MVVAPEPAVKGCGALGRGAVDRAVGPAAQHRADEALGLAAPVAQDLDVGHTRRVRPLPSAVAAASVSDELSSITHEMEVDPAMREELPSCPCARACCRRASELPLAAGWTAGRNPAPKPCTGRTDMTT